MISSISFDIEDQLEIRLSYDGDSMAFDVDGVSNNAREVFIRRDIPSDKIYLFADALENMANFLRNQRGF